MGPSTLKRALFVAGSLATALSMAFPAYAEYLTGLGGLLIGWSQLRRPGDQGGQ